MTLKAVEVSPKARLDLENHTLWLRDAADPDTAARFALAAIQSFSTLAKTPKLGPSVPSANPALAGIRKWRVDGFPKILIFYLPREDSLRIVRVLHAAADWWSLLDVH